MTSVQSTYCSLLRQALGLSTQDTLSTLNVADVDSLVHLAQIQGTAPLVYDQLLKAQPLSDSPLKGGELLLNLKRACMQNMMGYEQLLSLLKQTWNGLVQGGVQPVVLKGFGLASLYPIPYLRSWGDLDIYVGPQQYHQSAAILRQVFPDAKHHDEEREELKHYNFVLPDGNVVEMHRTSAILMHPIKNKHFLKLESDAMLPENVQWVEMEDVRFAIPEAQFNLLFTFYHAWEHFVREGLGFKQLADLALLAHHTYNYQSSTSDHQSIAYYLRRHLCRLHLWEPWQLIGYVCVTALGLPKSEWPLYEEGGARLQAQRKRFLQDVLYRGLMPRHQSDASMHKKAKQMNVVVRKCMTLKNRLASATEIMPYSPRYARHMMISSVINGIYRILTGAKMID